MAKKGARKSGGTGNLRKAKDAAMAARMRDVKRTTAACPICHKIVALDRLPFGHVCG